jgi:hypothetical protein
MNVHESNALSNYRAIVSSIFRLTMAMADGEHRAAADIFDSILHKLEHETRTTAKMADEMESTITNAFLAREIMRDEPPTLRIHPDAPSPLPDSYIAKAHVHVTKAEPDDHIVHLTTNPVVVKSVPIATVSKEEKFAAAPTTVRAPVSVSTNDTGSNADDEAEEEAEEEAEAEEEVEAEEAEAEEEVEAEAEEEVEAEAEEEVEAEAEEEVEEEAEEEEEEGMEVIKIGKKKYFCGENSRNVYVYVNDEEAGDCLGRYENGKIVPL